MFLSFRRLTAVLTFPRPSNRFEAQLLSAQTRSPQLRVCAVVGRPRLRRQIQMRPSQFVGYSIAVVAVVLLAVEARRASVVEISDQNFESIIGNPDTDVLVELLVPQRFGT